MSQPHGNKWGAASASKGNLRSKGPGTGKAVSPQRKPAFSPNGRHGALRGLLISVGNVLARDESGSLSRVSLNELRRGLSDFLGASRQDEREFLEAGTSSRSASAASTGGPATGDDEKERRRKQALAKKRDDLAVEKLRAYREAQGGV